MNKFAKRIIPCLDVNDGRVVKGINFINLIDAGDPVEVAKIYNDAGADELCFLDISASHQSRNTIVDVVAKVAKNLFIPLSVGGGIRKIDDINRLLDVGCDKVSINSAAIHNPNLIDEAAKKFGSQCIVIAVDAKEVSANKYNVFINGGRIDAGKDVYEWAKEVQTRGAGEILLTSMDKDGTKSGYDITLTKNVSLSLNIPVIASGGAGNMEHIKDILNAGADAALAASIFHFGEIKIPQLKKYLQENGIEVRK
ncbi:imidazole glycerol phosphate synthase subunit HisF [Campylobacter sputorum subsp. bubulus]|uniref:Imidazole glycerol phosphate synthase subunit HisF n=1 Tax=Campylobacter sputorum subsp. sputorum TaxID=32024 RepID=A0A381DKA4_9BACT|nr:imidazole glycerol phosphate synthase subunit HisF [Campylobacter sputorum]ASM35927.1 imidazole glycerol phosphate synthase HisFH, HisF subunit [Campylobacter sputorum aubsp. sputorum RM3237]ASM39274.1 imidazole glycerol phosphate synthase HisFH, HisF subunit [Campylobacter sputorum bv. paraureolyticus LMG 11764]KAB0582339.1 imidazole glycerol phosphate synthase subunit HisF [Campylobacter sputorum subsp. sputorum]MDY6121373.1 imidazole glycerol phosphate synthase subunit HisF [Campylobacter